MTDAAGDPFPPADRVMYSKAPLVQVVCQLRFPPILKIDSGQPAEFQEKIRGEFPLFERVTGPFGLGRPSLPPEIMQALSSNLGLAMGTAWNFLSEDRRTWVSLATDSLSVTTQSYSQWEKFTRQISGPFENLLTVYGPSYFSRVGLRYQDQIDRKKLGLEGVPWSELLRKEVLGEIAVPQIEANLIDARRVLRMKTPTGSGFITLQHGFAPNNPEQLYIIDFDFSAEPKTEVNDVRQVLDALHSGVGRAFRWCIQERLHKAMDPGPVPEPALS